MPVTNYIWDEVNDSLLMETDENGETTANHDSVGNRTAAREASGARVN